MITVGFLWLLYSFFFFIEPEKTWFVQLLTFTQIVRLSIYITKQ